VLVSVDAPLLADSVEEVVIGLDEVSFVFIDSVDGSDAVGVPADDDTFILSWSGKDSIEGYDVSHGGELWNSSR